MNEMVTLKIVLLIAVADVCYGATFLPSAYTYSGVASINGSDFNAGCLSNCRMTASNEKFCDCTGILSNTPGVLIDGIPTIDVNERGTWASPLYTADVTASSYAIGFRLTSSITLREVELHLFYCPTWRIPTRFDLTINIQRSLSFPLLISPTLVGNITLTEENSNCNSLIRVSITTQTPARPIYFIEFMSTTTLGGIYIGEIIFRDEVELSTSTLPLPTTSTTSLQTSIKTVFTLSSATTEIRSQQTTSSTSSLIRETTSAMQSTMGQTTGSFTDESINTTSSISDPSTTTSIDIFSNDSINPNSPTASNLLVPVVAALISVVLFMAITIIVGGTICLVIVIKLKRSVSFTNNRQQEQNTDDGYQYVASFNVRVRHGDNTGAQQPVTTDAIELVENTAYDTMKYMKDIKN